MRRSAAPARSTCPASRARSRFTSLLAQLVEELIEGFTMLDDRTVVVVDESSTLATAQTNVTVPYQL
ncbi:MAG TPA: hypothetical protein VK988_05965, partial [Acidimicrobiales bacterium]|nr:hypothetical protein [Acidimicrobiales bacterium]